ncbi:MAG: DUF3606 domain-containing protein [Hyphomonadaceae bacterium]|nr:DUF3606 domain-containing protein [Hyphomonadaceae bacterium]
MSDNRQDPGPLDGKLISLEQSYEVAFWSEALGITRDELREAVETVGHSAAAVRVYLADRPTVASETKSDPDVQ